MDIFNSHITKNAQETVALSQKLAALLTTKPELPRVICLYGNLGSGKTTFTQGIGLGLGITERILSPTYTLVREHEFGKMQKLYHLDGYRSTTGIDLGEMISNPNAFVVIEWADRFDNLPTTRIDIVCLNNEDDTHTITITNKS